MRVSNLIKILEDVKKFHGDKHIWGIGDLDFPCPHRFEIELTKTLKKTAMGVSGGKSGAITRLSVGVNYDGFDFYDHYIEEI